jgi:hypothetical protein
MMRTLPLWLAAAVVVAGCGGKVFVDGDAGGGGAPPITSCDQACARVAATCGGDAATCATQCQQNGFGPPACDASYQTLTSCIVNATDDVVCGAAMNVPASCQSLYDQWSACVETNP